MAWQDPYENVYAVVSGTKTFVLFPPFDLPHLHEERFVKGHYTYQGPLPSPMLHPPCCGAAGGARRVVVVVVVVVVVAAASLDSSPDAHERRREQMACLASRSTSPRRASHGSPVRGGSSREPLRCASTAAQADSTRCLQWILSGRTTLGTRTFTRCVCARVYMGGTSNVSLLVPQAKPFYVEVHAGDILYLPSLWYHQVGQIGDDEGKTVAIVRHSRAAAWLLAAHERHSSRPLSRTCGTTCSSTSSGATTASCATCCRPTGARCRSCKSLTMTMTMTLMTEPTARMRKVHRARARHAVMATAAVAAAAVVVVQQLTFNRHTLVVVVAAVRRYDAGSGVQYCRCMLGGCCGCGGSSRTA